MKTNREFADFLEGLTGVFGDGLKPAVAKEMVAWAEMIRDSPLALGKDLRKFIADCAAEKTESPPAVIRRVEDFRLGRGEPKEKLQGSIEKLKAADITSVLQGLGLDSKGRGPDKKRRLLEHLERGGSPSTAGEPAEESIRQFEQLRTELPDLGIDEMRRRLEEIMASGPAAIGAVAGRLGIRGAGNATTAAQIRESLEREMVRLQRVKNIRNQW